MSKVRAVAILVGTLATMLASAALVAQAQYELKRAVVRLRLEGSPPVRVLCTVRDPNAGYEDVVIWDPEDRRGAVRYALVPSAQPCPGVEAGAGAGTACPTAAGGNAHGLRLSCRTESLELTAEEGPSLLLRYSSATELVIDETSRPLTLKETVTGAAVRGTADEVKVHGELVVSRQERTAVLSQQTGAIQASRLRSLDPTALINDGLVALTAIALERASSAGQNYAAAVVLDVCDTLTVETLREKLKDAPLTHAVQTLGWPAERRILQKTCSLLESARLEDLVAEPEVVWKAIAVDASVLGAATLATNLFPDGERETLTKVVQAASGLLVSAITGGAPTTERDAQTLVLSLGRLVVAELSGDQKARAVRLSDATSAIATCLKEPTCTKPDGLSLPDVQEMLGSEVTAFVALEDGTRSFEGRDNLAAIWLELTRAHRRILNQVKAGLIAGQLGLGVSVIGECLQRGECAADELERLLRLELQLASQPEVLEQWPGLQPLLARIAAVLRPAPGTAPEVTAADAVAVVLDVFEHVFEQRAKDLARQFSSALAAVAASKEGIAKMRERAAKLAKGAPASANIGLVTRAEELRAEAVASERALVPFERIIDAADDDKKGAELGLAMIRLLRGVAASIRGEGGLSPLSELRNVFDELALKPQCEAQRDETLKKRCKLPLTSAQLRRTFKVLSALVTYGASYRGRTPREGEAAELAKQRSEERKEALEGLIDAVTDRSERSWEWVFGLGANVSVPADWRIRDREVYFNRMPLSLRTGLAFQLLPGDNSPLFLDSGVHLGACLLDLGQYASVRPDGGETEAVALEPITALRFGLEAGMLFGEPSYPIAVSAHLGYLPAVTYEDEGSGVRLSEVSFGVSAGVYVPFVDFN